MCMLMAGGLGREQDRKGDSGGVVGVGADVGARVGRVAACFVCLHCLKRCLERACVCQMMASTWNGESFVRWLCLF